MTAAAIGGPVDACLRHHVLRRSGLRHGEERFRGFHDRLFHRRAGRHFLGYKAAFIRTRPQKARCDQCRKARHPSARHPPIKAWAVPQSWQASQYQQQQHKRGDNARYLRPTVEAGFPYCPGHGGREQCDIHPHGKPREPEQQHRGGKQGDTSQGVVPRAAQHREICSAADQQQGSQPDYHGEAPDQPGAYAPPSRAAIGPALLCELLNARTRRAQVRSASRASRPGRPAMTRSPAPISSRTEARMLSLALTRCAAARSPLGPPTSVTTGVKAPASPPCLPRLQRLAPSRVLIASPLGHGPTRRAAASVARTRQEIQNVGLHRIKAFT